MAVCQKGGRGCHWVSVWIARSEAYDQKFGFWKSVLSASCDAYSMLLPPPFHLICHGQLLPFLFYWIIVNWCFNHWRGQARVPPRVLLLRGANVCGCLCLFAEKNKLKKKSWNVFVVNQRSRGLMVFSRTQRIMSKNKCIQRWLNLKSKKTKKSMNTFYSILTIYVSFLSLDIDQ